MDWGPRKPLGATEEVEGGGRHARGATWRSCCSHFSSLTISMLDHLAFHPWVFFHCWSFCQKQLGLQRALTNRAGTDLTVWVGSSSASKEVPLTVPAGVRGEWKRAVSCHQAAGRSCHFTGSWLKVCVCTNTRVPGRQCSVQGLGAVAHRMGHVLCSGKSPGIWAFYPGHLSNVS